MSMTINLYVTSSNPKSLTKALTQIGDAKVITPTAQISTLNPVLVLTYNAALLPCNYVYIPRFNRYYFATVSTDIAGRIILSCKVDYLMSWAAYIKECDANIIRAEQAGVNYVVDKQLPIDENRYFTEGKKFSNTPFDPNANLSLHPHYVVITR